MTEYISSCSTSSYLSKDSTIKEKFGNKEILFTGLPIAKAEMTKINQNKLFSSKKKEQKAKLRYDKLGNEITKTKKTHRITFIDQIENKEIKTIKIVKILQRFLQYNKS